MAVTHVWTPRQTRGQFTGAAQGEVHHCELLSGTASPLAPNHTLMTAYPSPTDHEWYLVVVHNWQHPTKLVTWVSQQFFGDRRGRNEARGAVLDDAVVTGDEGDAGGRRNRPCLGRTLPASTAVTITSKNMLQTSNEGATECETYEYR